MLYKKTTQTPNILFDVYLKTLRNAELKVLLTIIRKTVGIVDVTGDNKRVQQAWISQRLFMLCTGLSGKAVSDGITSLLDKKLIVITDVKGKLMLNKRERRAAYKLYYSSNSLLEINQEKKASEVAGNIPVKKGHTIKLIPIKPLRVKTSQEIIKLSDRERICQILQIKQDREQ